ncbi:MAG: hypothetical protein AAGB15_03540 [Pseudomonadota bacterium]
MKYLMISVVSCAPGYLAEACTHLTGVMRALRADLPSVTARFGSFMTGENAGSLALFHLYRDIADIEPAFDVYARSDDFKAMSASGQIGLSERNLIKLEAVGLADPPPNPPSPDPPRFGVLTHVSAPGALVEEVAALMPTYQAAGALAARYGTLLTGSHAGQRVLGVTYPSMASIEAAYDALDQSAAYQDLLRQLTQGQRDIVRILG